MWLEKFGYCLLLAVVSYCCGNFNGAIIISRFRYQSDIREQGSGNAGLTNFYRCYGKVGLSMVVTIDVVKAIVATLNGSVLLGSYGMELEGKALAMLFVIVGHIFPLTYEFRGGKGVLTACGALILIDVRLMLLLLGVFVLVVALTRYVSLGSITVALVAPFFFWFLSHSIMATILMACSAGLIIYMHRGNIKRLLHREESRFTIRK